MGGRRQDGRIEPGQKLSSAISARAWNRAQQAADIVLGSVPQAVGDPSLPLDRASNIVLVRNDSGQDVPWLGVLEFSGVVISPAGGTLAGNDSAGSKAREFVRDPVLIGVLPEASTKPFGVAVEPIAAGKIGRVAIGGRFPCKIKVLAAGHQYARARYNDVTQLISAECGAMRLLWSEGEGNDKFGVVVA